MILSQEIEHLFGLSGLGKRGVAAQIAEDDDDFTTMALKDLFVTLRNDQLGELRCKEPLQPTDAPQFLDLGGDARLKTTVQLRHFVGPLPQFAE